MPGRDRFRSTSTHVLSYSPLVSATISPVVIRIDPGLLMRLLNRGVPAYLLLALFYVGFVIFIAGPGMLQGEAAEGATPISAQIEQAMGYGFNVRFPSGVEFPITWTTFFIAGGFLSAWVEALRAANARISGNDFMSLIVTIVSLVLFIVVPWFSTTAFMIVPLVGIGDLILDRYIGQAVARRDFGPYPGAE